MQCTSFKSVCSLGTKLCRFCTCSLGAVVVQRQQQHGNTKSRITVGDEGTPPPPAPTGAQYGQQMGVNWSKGGKPARGNNTQQGPPCGTPRPATYLFLQRAFQARLEAFQPLVFAEVAGQSGPQKKKHSKNTKITNAATALPEPYRRMTPFQRVGPGG